MKNFISGVLLVVVVVLLGLIFNHAREYSYRCEMQGNVIGIEGWECKNYITGHTIKGFATTQQRNEVDRNN